MGKGKEFWRSHVLASGPRGTRLEGYAREHGLKLQTLRWWRSRLWEEVAVARVSGSRFVALRVTPSVELDQPRPAVTAVRIGERIRLELLGVPTPQWLAAMDRALREQA